MKCPHCQTQCKDSAKFCQCCGKSLTSLPQDKTPICPQCHTTNPSTAKFCKKCGRPFNEPTTPANKALIAQTDAAVPTTSKASVFNVEHAKLSCILGALQGMNFKVDKGVVIGRAASADIVITDDREISKTHSWIGIVNGRLILRDLDSTNGTFLNDDLDAPITECEIKDGDVIVCGRHNALKFRLTVD